jgi:diacylglycerol kinase family enzyme
VNQPLRLLLIVNASASSVTARTRVVIQKALAADHRVTVAETSRRGHASRLAQGAAADGVDVVVVLGGDGTLSEAANGLAGTSTALAVLPGGSTNVYARSIGMTNDPVEATGELLTALAQRSIRPVTLGQVNGRYFLFHVGIGYDAAVVEQVERRGTLKRYAGHPLFIYAAIVTWLGSYDRRKPHFQVAIPGRADVTDAYFAICLKTNPYTFLRDRPLDVAPGTGLDTGLSMVTFRSLRLRRLVPLALSALRRGQRLEQDPSVDLVRNPSEVVVTGYGPFPYQVDGDYLGTTERLELVAVPDALHLVVPQKV